MKSPFRHLVILAFAAMVPLYASAAESVKIMMVPKGDHPYFKPCYEGLRDAAAKYGVEAEVIIPKGWSIQDQVAAIEECIAQGANGIAISALDDKGLVPVIQKAVGAGIKVVTFDAPAPSSAAVSYIGTDNKRAGEKAAEAFVRALEKEGWGDDEVAILQGGLDAPNLNERFEAMRDYIKKNAPGMTIIGPEDVDGKIEIATAKTKSILEAHPNIRGIFSVSAEGTPGAAKAVEEMGKKGEVIVAGFDDMPETLKAIREGVVSFCLAQRTYKMGWLSLETLLNVIRGEDVPKEIDTGVLIVTTDTVNSYIQKYQSILRTR